MRAPRNPDQYRDGRRWIYSETAGRYLESAREGADVRCSATFPWALGDCPNLADYWREGAPVCVECLDALREIERATDSD